MVRGERFAIPIHLEDMRLGAERFPLFWIDSALKAARLSHGLRHIDELVGVEVEVREDRVVLGCTRVLVVVLKKRVRRPRHAGDVVGVDESLSPQRFRVPDE